VTEGFLNRARTRKSFACGPGVQGRPDHPTDGFLSEPHLIWRFVNGVLLIESLMSSKCLSEGRAIQRSSVRTSGLFVTKLKFGRQKETREEQRHFGGPRRTNRVSRSQRPKTRLHAMSKPLFNLQSRRTEAASSSPHRPRSAPSTESGSSGRNIQEPA
jgi:hypothetical protein